VLRIHESERFITVSPADTGIVTIMDVFIKAVTELGFPVEETYRAQESSSSEVPIRLAASQEESLAWLHVADFQ